MMFKRNIIFKISVGYMIIALISMLVIGIFFIDLFRNYTFKSKESDMLNRAKEIAKVTDQYIFKNANKKDKDNFIEIIDTITNARVWITDEKGNIVVMSYGMLEEESEKGECKIGQTDITDIKAVLMGKDVKKEGYSYFYREPMITVGAPIYDNKDIVLGTVFLHSSIIGVTDSIDKAFNILLISILLTLILSALLGIVYSTIITKPIKAMNNVAIEMTRGNYDLRTNIRQKDEIGQLGNSLDILSSKLGYTIEQLYQEKSKLDDLIASISEGILAFDLNMKLINYNQALRKLFEYKSNDIIEENVKKDLLKYGLWDEFKEVIKSEKGNVTVVKWNIRKLKFIISPVTSSTRDIIGVVALIHDISESERLEQMRLDFVANVSHEFRTPLTVIRGSVEALIDEAITNDEIKKKFLNRIFNESKGLERLVEDLLDLGKLQMGKFDLQFEKINITEILTDVINSLKSIADKKKIKIERNIQGELPQIIGDYDRLRQLFVIFIDNAIKYSKKNTRIDVSVWFENYVYVKIKDNGIGIAKEDLPYIWDRFYRGDKSRSQQEAGTGLGLSIAKYIIEGHEGVVEIDSDLGSGTSVEVGLPYEK